MLGIVLKKQKLNNYDVIESYAEDFTRLNYYEHRGTIDRILIKIVITESKTDILNINWKFKYFH